MMSVEQAQPYCVKAGLPRRNVHLRQFWPKNLTMSKRWNMMALVAQRSADFSSALALIQRALRVDALNRRRCTIMGAFWTPRSATRKRAAAQRAALKVEPNLFAARLYLGRALERSGEPHQAILAYARVLQDAQADGRWLNEASTPAAFRPLVEHAVLQVKQGRRAAIARLLEPLVRTYGRDSMRRVDKSLRVYFKEEAAALPDPGNGRASFTSRIFP
jgi:aspartate beta-hydroxylase